MAIRSPRLTRKAAIGRAKRIKAIVRRQYSPHTMTLYDFTRVPFGLCNTTATFHRVMAVILSTVKKKYAFVHLDNIVIF